MITVYVEDAWPAGIVDKLTLPCSDCDKSPSVDYHVENDEWARVVPDYPAHLSVVCLECFMKRGGDITKIDKIQILGDGVTSIFAPDIAYNWKNA